MPGQLTLPFAHTPDYASLDLLPHAGLEDAQAWLARADWPGGRLALWGEAGVGKTHLLHWWADRVHARIVPGATLHAWPAGPLAIDDADLAPDLPLLHVLNAAAEAGRPVLLAARAPPARWPTGLADLRSRLRAITAVGLHPGDDAFRRTLLARLLSDRQLVAPPALQDWLLTRLPRDPGALREAVARMDHAALAAGLAISRKLATAALGDLLHDTSLEPSTPDVSPANASPDDPFLS